MWKATILSEYDVQESDGANPSREKLLLWQRTENPKHRAGIQPSDDTDRAKELDGLARDTKVRKTGGQREFLLHRGMGTDEFFDLWSEEDAIHGNKVPMSKPVSYRKKSSWSVEESVAAGFAKAKGMLDPNPGVLVSAWIPEDKVVVYMPFHAEEEGGHFKNVHYSQTEKEVIVDKGLITDDFTFEGGKPLRTFGKKSS